MRLVCVEVDFLVCLARVVECSGADGEVSQLGGTWVWAEDGGEASLTNVGKSFIDGIELSGVNCVNTYLEFCIFIPIIRVQLIEELFVV